jgi:HEAT repeat protein
MRSFIRSLMVGVVLVSAAASAAAPKNKGSIGDAKDDDPPVQTQTQVKPAAAGNNSDADLGLLRGLMYAFEPAPTEIRVQAIEDLGLLGDPRALNPLAELLVDPNPQVQLAALRAVGLIRAPRAEEILSNVVRHPTMPEYLKLKAVDYVLFQNTKGAVYFLWQVASANTWGYNVQNKARQTLMEVPPQRRGATK